jgi:hypothetical protein
MMYSGCLNSPLPPDEASLLITFVLDGSENSEGVEVILPGTSYRGYSDREGRVVFDHLPPRDYELLAQKEGYQDYRERKITLESGDHIDLGEIHLVYIPKDGTVIGKVSVEDIPGATVEISLEGSDGAVIYSATDGSFSLAKVPPGKQQVRFSYLVTASPGNLLTPEYADEIRSVSVEAGEIISLGEIMISYQPLPTPTQAPVPTRSTPTAASQKNPSPQLTPSPLATPTVTLDPNSPSILKGYAFYPDRQDHSGILVRVVDPPRQATTDSTGMYLITDVPGGKRALRAEAEGYLPFDLEDLAVLPGEVTSPPKIQLQVDPTTLTIAQSRVYGQVFLSDQGVQPGVLISLEGTGLNTVTARDGTFLFNAVPTGQYTVIATREGYESFTTEIEVPQTGEDVPIAVITLQPIPIYLQVVETHPAQRAKKVPVTDRVHVEVRFNERFASGAVRDAVTVFPHAAHRIESPEGDLITIDLLRTEQPPVEFERDYAITVNTNLVSTEKHRLERPYVLTFKTGGPRIISSGPPSGARGIILAPDQPIVIEFNQAVNLKQLADRLRVTPHTGEVPTIRPQRVPYGQRVEIQLQVAPNRTYRIMIPSSVHTDSDDRRYENTPYSIQFRTGSYEDLPDLNNEYLNEINDFMGN